MRRGPCGQGGGSCPRRVWGRNPGADHLQVQAVIGHHQSCIHLIIHQSCVLVRRCGGQAQSLSGDKPSVRPAASCTEAGHRSISAMQPQHQSSVISHAATAPAISHQSSAISHQPSVMQPQHQPSVMQPQHQLSAISHAATASVISHQSPWISSVRSRL